MTAYEFTLILSDVSELTDELANKLFAVGCDQATPSSSDGIVSLDYRVEAKNLESAIRPAISKVSAAGYTIERVVVRSTEDGQGRLIGATPT